MIAGQGTIGLELMEARPDLDTILVPLSGGGLAAGAVLVTILLGPTDGWAGALLAQPAAWSLPLAFLTMVVVSLLTSREIPTGVRRIMVRLHTPESLDLDRGANLTGRGGRWP